jgi:hypothetical protein
MTSPHKQRFFNSTGKEIMFDAELCAIHKRYDLVKEQLETKFNQWLSEYLDWLEQDDDIQIEETAIDDWNCHWRRLVHISLCDLVAMLDDPDRLTLGLSDVESLLDLTCTGNRGFERTHQTHSNKFCEFITHTLHEELSPDIDSDEEMGEFLELESRLLGDLLYQDVFRERVEECDDEGEGDTETIESDLRL